MTTITTTGDYEADYTATMSIVGLPVTDWIKHGASQSATVDHGMIVARADRHGLPVLREANPAPGTYPLTVTVGYGDTVTVAS